jgi:hypothetical protein
MYACSIEILGMYVGAMLHRRSVYEIREKIFQLISTLFCEVKRGFVDPRKIVP